MSWPLTLFYIKSLHKKTRGQLIEDNILFNVKPVVPSLLACDPLQ